MKYKTYLLGCIFLLGGCCTRGPVPETPVLQDPTPQISTTETAPAPLEQPASAPVAQGQKIIQPIQAVKPTEPAPQVSAAAVTESAAPQTPSAAGSAAPVPDQPVFKDEPLINLQGRLLNPLAVHAPQPDHHIQTPWKGEQLKYGIYYSFIKAGTAYIKNRGIIEADGHTAYVIQTSAFSAPVIDSVFKVRDINLSWLDAKTFYSLGYTQSLREGKYKRDEWIRFDYPQHKYYGQVQKKSSPRSFSAELDQPVLDMLTALYYVRTQPLSPGQEVIFDIINREEKYPLVVKVLGRETVKTEAGKFKCLVVEPQFRGEGIFVSKGKNLKVWLTDDKYKMPIKMKAEVFIGSVSAELLEYKRN